jgi:hypothetical protein
MDFSLTSLCIRRWLLLSEQSQILPANPEVADIQYEQADAAATPI